MSGRSRLLPEQRLREPELPGFPGGYGMLVTGLK